MKRNNKHNKGIIFAFIYSPCPVFAHLHWIEQRTVSSFMFYKSVGRTTRNTRSEIATRLTDKINLNTS